jgi:hypothetical protein
VSDNIEGPYKDPLGKPLSQFAIKGVLELIGALLDSCFYLRILSSDKSVLLGKSSLQALNLSF